MILIMTSIKIIIILLLLIILLSEFQQFNGTIEVDDGLMRGYCSVDDNDNTSSRNRIGNDSSNEVDKKYDVNNMAEQIKKIK